MSGLQLLLPFDGNAKDYSGNSYNGTVTGASYVTGKRDQALDFNGATDKVAIGDVLDFAGTLPFTITAWIKSDVIGAPQQIVFKMSGADGYEFYLKGAGQISLVRWLSAPLTQAISTGSTVLVAGTYYHVGCTYDGAEQLLYVNGVADCTAVADTLSIPDTAGELTIGRQNVNPAEPFNGIIDEVHIYNRALTPTEMRAFVYPTAFSQLISQIERIPTPTKMVVDSGLVEVDGVVHRVDVFIPLFDRLKDSTER